MESATRSTPGKFIVIIVSLVTLLFVSAVECYDGRHDVEHSAVARRSRLEARQHRGTTAPHRYVVAVAEKSSTPGGGGRSSGPKNRGSLAPPTHRHRVCNRIIVFVVGSLAGVIAGPVLFVLLRVALNFIRDRGRYRSRSGVIIFTLNLIRRPEHLAFLEKEDGLASLTVIGKGGCGEVYRAQLPVEQEGDEPCFIAIKKIKQHNCDVSDNNLSDRETTRQLEEKSRQIQSEIRTVGLIRHRNLLPLAAHVPRPDCHYLVYEYMKNGSLEQALKAGSVEDGSSTGLSWPARLRVALGVSAGLEYLHFFHRPQIIHRDIKTANILLDDDLEPRIADFGLAADMPDSHTHVTGSNVVGTVGYIAPEYKICAKFTSKCDVYSFGIILVALATGKEPTDQFFTQMDESQGMAVGPVIWLRGVMKAGEHAQAIDPAITGVGYDEQILSVLRIALLCTKDKPKERPTAKEVRCMLSKINTVPSQAELSGGQHGRRPPLPPC